MRQFTQEEIPDDLVKSNVKNPPWGTEPETPSTASGVRRKGFPWTTYSRDYIGAPGSVAAPQRMKTADHLPGGWPFERSHYAGTFRTPQVNYSRHSVPTPISVHRRNNPHPRLTDPWQYPDKTYLVWKNNLAAEDETPRQVQSAPVNILQSDKHRWFNTTYKTTFTGKPLVPQSYKHYNPWKPERFRQNPKAQTPALQWQTTTTHDFRGGYGKPSTTERPYDMSWSNLSL